MRIRGTPTAWAAATVWVGAAWAPLAAQPQRPTAPDLVYASVAGRALTLDLYLPSGIEEPPLIVYVHGGAWRGGSKDRGVPTVFVDEGFALASVDFRLSGEAPFPAQLHDIKAAIRFLRSEASRLAFDPELIAIMGRSSGGHLAALVGVTGDDPGLEGEIGEHLDLPSSVAAIVSYSGASNLMTILDQSTPHGLRVREPALRLLLGALPSERPSLATRASPVTHVDPGDPPLLLLHGDQDPQMPINQAHELEGAYERVGGDATFVVVHGAGHGGSVFFEGRALAATLDFLERTIRR